MVYVFLANGFEETEAVAPIDLLRRAGLTVQTVAVGTQGLAVTGANGITVQADLAEQAVDLTGLQAVVLPGGMPGTKHLKASDTVQAAVRHCHRHNLPIGAICAAPSVLGSMGLLAGVTATCFPGFEAELTGARVLPESLCCDRNIITAKGAGVAIEFGLKLTEVLCGAQQAEQLRKSIQCR